ncbi:MAG: hypothetical protein AUH30_17330 [Candidatus Rokubacteria bacterium 13_1_40CM_68_15]|nr:MAG: hypothetical protein AUH30_17330 [Candidatus Rokubacteria bacterium 13_1_40CM_68_15]
MELAQNVCVAQTSAQAWIEEYRALPRLYQASRRPQRPRRVSARRVRVCRTVIALSGSLLWVAMIRYVLHLG